MGLACVAAALAVAGCGGSRLSHRSRPPAGTTGQRRHGAAVAAPVRVSLGSGAATIGVPASFLGVSFEDWGLAQFERRGVLFDRVLSLLRPSGAGPLIVRVGGNSADRTFWDSDPAHPGRPLAHWAFALTPEFFAETARMLRRVGARLIVDLNLATATPAAAARLAGAAADRLPPGRIAGFEVGNEPDLYAHDGWLAAIARTVPGPARAALAMSPAAYARDFTGYARRLARAAPRAPLLGPAVGYPRRDARWIAGLLDRPHPRLGIVSGHLYPFTACPRPGSPAYPTIAGLLSEHATAGLAALITPAVALAHRRGLAFRVDELGSASCGGRPGVSDAFATALWAPDALFELLRAGVVGVNVHVRAEAANGAFALTGDGLVARPLLYGLILFARTVGAGGRLMKVTVRAPRSEHLKVWAVRVADGALHVLVIDKGGRAATVSLRLPATGAATVQRLLARSATATSGVTLDGQRLGRDGRWHGRPLPQTILPKGGGYTLTLPRRSAVLLSVPVVPGAARSRGG